MVVSRPAMGWITGGRAAVGGLLAEPIAGKTLGAGQRGDLDFAEQQRGAGAVMPLSGLRRSKRFRA